MSVRSTFAGYNLSISGMYVNQSALAAVSSNISNVNTEGYSRKQVNSAEQVVALPGGVSVGSGVTLAEVRRARDGLLDQTYRNYNGQKSYWETKSSNLDDIQETLNEYAAKDGSSSNGLQQTVEDFFDSWEELSKDPSSLSNRQTVLENAATLVSTLQDIDQQLQEMQQDCATQVRDGVAQLNDLAGQVADLNSQITTAELSGVEAGDLRDQRDLILDQMSSLANIKTQEQGGVFEVTIGGVSLVRGSQVRQLTTAGDGTADSPLKVQWQDLNCDADISSGSIQANLEDCDVGAVQDVTTFPCDFSAASGSSIGNLRQGLNVMLTTIAQQINTLHTSGTDLDGNAGLDFFTTVDASQPLSLDNIEVNPELTDDPDKVVTSGSSGDASDNTIAKEIYSLMEDEDLFQFNNLSTDLTGYYESLISWLSTAGDNASGYYDTQSSLVTNVNTQRQSISAVSLDEEMAKMMTYQKAYNANAKVLSTIDSLLGDLIHDLGGN